AIAIPVFLSQRNSARDASVKSDINGVAKVMETLYVEDNAYPTTTILLEAGNPQISPGNQLVVTLTGGGTGYTIVGCNIDADVAYTYDSTDGGLNPDGLATATCTTEGVSVA
ncbi:MAG: type pilus assembly protein PilA, partial [Actinomycetota bacterium]|nr:type pilus assembly protein PilA [Actinomycetota bacterium]